MRMIAAMLALVGLLWTTTACGSRWPSENEQLEQFISLLASNGHRIDEVSDTNPPRLNAKVETETETKQRKAKSKTITIKKKSRIAEVVVVAHDSNCKFEFELPLNQDPRDGYYADEGRDKNGKEMDLLTGLNPDRPSPQALREHVSAHSKNALAFCLGAYAPSAHSDD